MAVDEAYFILYVQDKKASASFYGEVLAQEPILDVPGITEYRLTDTDILGLIPIESARRLIGDVFPTTSNVPKAELYVLVDDPEAYHARALRAGAKELSPMQLRNWGHRAAYSVDRDGHVLAFGCRVSSS